MENNYRLKNRRRITRLFNDREKKRKINELNQRKQSRIHRVDDKRKYNIKRITVCVKSEYSTSLYENDILIFTTKI